MDMMKRHIQSLTVMTMLGITLVACEPRSIASRGIEAQPVASAPPVAEPSQLPKPIKAAPDEPQPIAKEAEHAMLAGPNAVPKDTRVVVNIPAFRMDVFSNGTLIKSYTIGIGYPQFPIPTGLQKADLIIFNPTWTPPHSSWVNSMNVAPGQVISAGSKSNPLGPIKIPIGSPSLIHGGKPISKIGTFASHGCVGLTNDQVKDFATVLAQAAGNELTGETLADYLKSRTRTRTLKLNNVVPVELRYETIVIEDGRLYIHKDVYGKRTNTEENLRAAFAANGLSFDNLSEAEKAQALEALTAMSAEQRKVGVSKRFQKTIGTTTALNEQREAAERVKKLRNQKEVSIEIAALIGKGYPAAANLDDGKGVSGSVAQR
jgi:lipoprotein-anchoring transpeptidase ErfK/SrfK